MTINHCAGLMASTAVMSSSFFFPLMHTYMKWKFFSGFSLFYGVIVAVIVGLGSSCTQIPQS